MPVISLKIGDHCYHGLCDMVASASAIPISLYKEIMHDIAPAEIEDIDVTITLANRDTISPVGIVRYSPRSFLLCTLDLPKVKLC